MASPGPGAQDGEQLPLTMRIVEILRPRDRKTGPATAEVTGIAFRSIAPIGVPGNAQTGGSGGVRSFFVGDLLCPDLPETSEAKERGSSQLLRESTRLASSNPPNSWKFGRPGAR